MEQFFLDFAEAISPALQTLLQGLAAVIAAQIVAYVRKAYEDKVQSLNENQRYFLGLIVSSAVRAAEQVYSDGAEKRQYAFQVVEAALKRAGITLDVDVIYAEIEAQVFSNFHEKG